MVTDSLSDDMNVVCFDKPRLQLFETPACFCFLVPEFLADFRSDALSFMGDNGLSNHWWFV